MSEATSAGAHRADPSFSRADESKVPRALDRLSPVLGDFPYAVMMKLIGPAFKSSLPPHRRDALVAELKKNDPRFLRAQTRHCLDYLDRHRSLVPRLCQSAVPAWVVFGQHDDTGLTESARTRGLSGGQPRDDPGRRPLRAQPATGAGRRSAPEGHIEHPADVNHRPRWWRCVKGPPVGAERFASFRYPRAPRAGGEVWVESLPSGARRSPSMAVSPARNAESDRPLTSDRTRWLRRPAWATCGWTTTPALVVHGSRVERVPGRRGVRAASSV